MPQRIEAFGNIIEFPDGMSDADMLKAIRNNEHNLNPDYKTPEPEAMDYAKGFAIGSNKLVSGLGYLAEKAGADNVGKQIRDFGDRGAAYWNDKLSEGGKVAAKSQVFVDDPESLTGIKLSDHWGKALMMGASQSVPSMFAAALPGAAVTKGIQALAKLGLAGGSGATIPLLAGTASPVGNASKAISRIPSAIGFGLVGEGVAAGSMNAADMKSSIEKMSEDELAKSPVYNALNAQYGPKKARSLLAEQAASDVFGRTTLTTGILGALTGGGALGQAYQKATLGGADGIFKSAAKGAASEAIQEAPQSAGEKYIENLAVGDYLDPNRSPSEGVAAAAASGAAIGGLTGGVVGAGGKVNLTQSRTERVLREREKLAKMRADAENRKSVSDGVGNVGNAQSVDEAILAANEMVSKSPVTKDDVLREMEPTLADIENITGLKPSESIEAAINEAQQTIQVENNEEKTGQTANAEAAVLNKQNEIVLPDGNSLPVKWDVVDADSIKATIKDGINQPRDRTRAASDVQIQGIANRPDYRRLSDSPVMDVGAPVIDATGAIVAGNGRFDGVSRSYDINKHGEYYQSLMSDLVNKGIDPSILTGMKKPVLVRRISQPFDTRQLAIMSNSGGSLQYSALEHSKIDADRMKDIHDLDISDNGEIPLTSGNIGKIRTSLSTYTPAEQSSFLDASGSLSQEGVKRIRNALLYKAYGDSSTLSRLVESTDTDMRNVLGVLTKVSGDVAKVRSDINSGAIPKELDVTDNLVNAVETLSQIRTKNQLLDQYLAQENLFGDNIDPDSKEILQYLHDNIRSQKKLTEFIRNVYDQVGRIDQSTDNIFGDNATPSKKELIDNAKPKEQAEQQGIFEGTSRQSSPADEQKSKTETDHAGSGTKSWVVREKSTGKVIFETSDKKKVDALNTEKYEAVPTKDHLVELNDPNSKVRQYAERPNQNEPEFSRSAEERLKDRERAKQLETKLKAQGYNFRITARDVRDFSSDDRGKADEAATAEKIAKIFGRRVVWIEAKGDHAINGVVIPSIKDTVYIDVNTKKAVHAVLGHELSHHLEFDKPEVYKELTRSLITVITDHQQYAKKYGMDGARDADITREIVGDIMGDSFADPQFWNRVAEANPGAFKSIADTVIAWLKKLVTNAKMRGMGSEQWVTDVKKAQDILADAIAKYTTHTSNTDSAKPKLSRSEIPETINIDGIERPTRNSNGQLIHPTEEGIRNFWKWFGDSKVVDEDGMPLMVLHGTGNDINAFDLSLVGKRLDSGFFGKGIYLTTNAQTASYYSKISGSSAPNTMPLYASLLNPYQWGKKSLGVRGEVMQGIGIPDDLREATLNRVGFIFNGNSEPDFSAEPKLSNALRDELMARGYDGVIATFAEKDGVVDMEIVAFNSNQVKSALGNTGAFSSDNDDIRFSRRNDVTRKISYPIDAADPIFAFNNSERIKLHKDYKAAKSGDFEAADRLVNDLVPEENVSQAMDAFGEDVVYVPVVLKEQSGTNRIPHAMAVLYASKNNASISTDIYEVEKAFHTGMKMMERLVSRAAFAGNVERGVKYVLVDDVTTTGATLADLSSYIQENGGIVVGSVLLTNAMRTGSMHSPPKTIQRLEVQHGNAIRELFGIEPQSLTKEESQYLIGFRTDDELRNSAAKARDSRSERILLKKASKPQDSVNQLPETISINGADRPTRDSEGNLIHPSEEGIRNFYEWFADSKITDSQGRPLVVYHRTRNDFSAFDPELIGEATDTGFFGKGIYLTPSKSGASIYASNDLTQSEAKEVPGGQVMPLYVRASKVHETAKPGMSEEKVRLLKKNGFDAIFSKQDKNTINEEDELVVFYPSQVKSAIGNTGAFSSDNDDIRFSRAGKQSDEDVAFADEVLRELASVDELFRYPVSSKHSLEDVMAEVYPGTKYRGENTREDERSESGADHRFVFTSPYGRTFYVYERDNGEVFIDVSRFNPGEKGQAVYAAVANYAFNNDKVFIADPAGLTEDSLIRRTANMLSSALRYGTTRHLDAAPQQIKGDKKNGIEPLDWRGDDLAKTKALIHTFITTLHNKFPELKGYKYDFNKRQFVDRRGRPTGPDRFADAERLGMARSSRAGQATMRQGVFIQSLISSESSERPGILEHVITRASSLVSGGGLKALFSKTPRDNSVEIPEETKFRKTQRLTQDAFNRFTVIKDWLAKRGQKLSEKADVYAAEERYHSRVANQLEDFREKIRNPLIEKIAKAGFTLSDVSDFLEAQHTEEANAAIRKLTDDPDTTAYGITDKEAQEYLKNASPELAKLSNELRNVTELSKQLRLKNGLLSQEEVDAWEAAYNHYIPVKGDSEASKGTGKGLKVNFKTKRRLGHGRRDEAVIENILMDHERAIMQVEKNRVAKHLVMMAAEIGMPEIMTIGQPEKRKVLKNTTAFEVQVKGAVHGVFESREAANMFKKLLTTTNQKVSAGDVVIVPTTDQRIVATASQMLSDNEVNAYFDGHAIRIQINDELLARAYGKLGVTGFSAIVNAGRMINGYLSKVYTGYNPEFIITNLIRDFTSGIINLTGEQGIKMAAKTVGNYVKSFASLLKYAATGESDTWIDRYRNTGGNTGAAYLSDLERLGDEVKTEFASYQGVISNLKQKDFANASRAAGRKVFNKTLKWIYVLNQAGENAMRLSAFRAMIESGESPLKAASVAKNITVNFNRKGEFGAEANAAYLFFNASVQGTAAIAHSLTKGEHKYEALALSGAMATLGYLAAAALAGGDEDEYDKVNDYTKERNMLIKAGDGYAQIPIPYGYGFFWNLGRLIADAQRKGELGKLPWHIASSAIEELTPFSDTVVGNDGEFQADQVFLGLLPTVAKIPAQPILNKQLFSGGELMPDSPFKQFQPDREKMWRATQGTMFDHVAGWLEAGLGMDVSPETLKHYTRTLTGGAGNMVDTSVSAGLLKAQGAGLETSEIPFYRKAYTELTIKDHRSAYYKASEEAKKAAEEFSRAKEKNDLGLMNKVLEDKKELIALDKYANKLSKVISVIRDEQDAIRMSDTLTAAEKRLRIKESELREEKLYDQYLDVFKTKTIKN